MMNRILDWVATLIGLAVALGGICFAGYLIYKSWDWPGVTAVIIMALFVFAVEAVSFPEEDDDAD